MAVGPRSGFYYAVAAIPFLVAGIVGPDVFHASEDSKRVIFAICLALAVCCVIAGAVKEKYEEEHKPAGGHGRRMIALVGMLICGVGFLSFSGVYFWPTVKEAEKSQLSPIISSLPDVTLRFVHPEFPSLVLVNDSDVVAKTIKWSVVLWNLDDPRTYTNPNPAPENHDPLPIPVSTFDFIRPKTTGGPQNLFNTSLVFPYLKEGQRLFGSASVICPECVRGHTYIVSIVWGKGGWYAETSNVADGQLILPEKATKIGVVDYYKRLISLIPESDRIPIEQQPGIIISPLGAPSSAVPSPPPRGGDVNIQGSVSAGTSGQQNKGGDTNIEGGTGYHGASGGNVTLGPGDFKAGDAGPGGNGGNLNVKGGAAK